MTYTPEEKFKLLEKILENNPNGLQLSIARKETHLSYDAIKNKIVALGYEIRKKSIMVKRFCNVIVKKESDLNA